MATPMPRPTAVTPADTPSRKLSASVMELLFTVSVPESPVMLIFAPLSTSVSCFRSLPACAQPAAAPMPPAPAVTESALELTSE